MSINNGLMKGKRGVILGVANNRSIAWAIAKAIKREGAEIALTYQMDIFKKRVLPLAEEIGASILTKCDISDDEEIENLANHLKEEWGSIDFFVHSIAFTNKENLRQPYMTVTRESFANTMDISCFSLTALCQKLYPIMNEGGSVLTLSYYGANKYIPNYNVMAVAKAALESSVRYLAIDLAGKKVRINALSAGTVKTLAAGGIGDFNYIMLANALNTPMRRNVTIKEVGNSGLYLLSDLSSGVTGEIHYVDCGFNKVGMLDPDTIPELERVTSEKLL